MPYEPASILSVGSIIRLAGPDGLDEATHDGTVTEVSNNRVIAQFTGWLEIWNAHGLTFDPESGVWTASNPGEIMDTV